MQKREYVAESGAYVAPFYRRGILKNQNHCSDAYEMPEYGQNPHENGPNTNENGPNTSEHVQKKQFRHNPGTFARVHIRILFRIRYART